MTPSLWLAMALLLLVAGVVGSVAPMIPGPLLSVSGVLLYWWSTGYSDPATIFVASVVLIGVVAIAVDLLASAISSKVGGASTASAVVAAIVGTLAFFVAGPVGTLLGIAIAVFATELYLHGDLQRGATASLWAVLGVLASAVVQLLLTLGILFGFLLVIV